VSDEGGGPVRGADVVEELAASGALHALFAQIDAGEVELTGDRGLIPGLIKAAPERGLRAERGDHLGYDKGDRRRRCALATIWCHVQYKILGYPVRVFPDAARASKADDHLSVPRTAQPPSGDYMRHREGENVT
jgi:hypothetical protein